MVQRTIEVRSEIGHTLSEALKKVGVAVEGHVGVVSETQEGERLELRKRAED